MMPAIDPQDVARYVAAAKALKTGRRFYDIHVHPHDIVFNQLAYERTGNPGLHRAHAAPYAPPSLGRLPLSSPGPAKPMSDEWRSRIFAMTLRQRYGHTGPLVVSDQMALCGIDEVLLLPVAGPSGPFMEQMAWIYEIFSGDDRCHLAGSVPSDVPVANLSSYVGEMVHRFGIRAVKLHPNIGGLNLATSRAKEWLEAVLSACGANRLPLILHVGRNAVLPRMEMAANADIDHFDGIDWSIADSPIVFAHAGLYCCEADDVDGRIFPKLTKLLQAHEHLMVDIADLDFDAVRKVVGTLDADRILFGSDALYATQWSMMVTLFIALSTVFSPSDAEDRFVAIMSDNPRNALFAPSNGFIDDAQAHRVERAANGVSR